MTGYTPEQVPVISALARGFGVFDHWFSEVPSQTLANRSFWTAATSSGFVVNRPMTQLHAPQHGRDDLRPARASRQDLEGLRARARPHLLHRLHPHGAPAGPLRHQLRALRRVRAGRGRRARCPTSRLIEPNLLAGPRRLPPRLRTGPDRRTRRADRRARRRSSPARPSWPGSTAPCASAASEKGSNVFNTMLFVGFDEPGGTYDHVPPGPVPPPDPAEPRRPARVRLRPLRLPGPGQSSSRPGCRPGSVFTDEYRHTSMIATLRAVWNLGEPFTARDAAARTFGHLLSLETPRTPARGRTSSRSRCPPSKLSG